MKRSNSSPGSWCYVISLKYSPVHKTLSRAFGEPIERAGGRVRYLLSKAYRWMEENHETADIDYVTVSDSAVSIVRDVVYFCVGGWLRFVVLFSRYPPQLLYFTNLHPLNPLIMILARCLCPDVLVMCLLHEPYKEDKCYYSTAKAFYILIVEFLQGLALRITNVSIVPSRTAERVFRLRYPGFRGLLKVVPLLFEDKACPSDLPRQYVSFIGHATQQKGVAQFFSLVEESARRGLGIDFLIATSSDISSYLAALPSEALEKLQVVNPAKLNDEEICHVAKQSYAVLLLYTTVTQSAVLSVAYMNGTPVVATDLEGLVEFVRHEYNGWIVPRDPSNNDVLEGICWLRMHSPELSANCRRTYETVFDVANFPQHMDWLLPTG